MHTSSLKKYAIGLAVVAVVSEVPFDLVYSGSVWNPYRQNPVFSLLIGLGILVLMEKAEVSLAQSSPLEAEQQQAADRRRRLRDLRGSEC